MDHGPAAPSDASLAEAIARGEQAAEAELFERFAPRVFFLARRELRSHDLAEDARSETFLRAIQAIRQGHLRSPDALGSFLLQTTRHVIYEMLRQRRRAPDSLDEQQANDVPVPAPDTLDPEVEEAVRETLRDLSARDRMFLKLHFDDELPKAEIGRRLGIDPERVRLIKSRALERFRHALKRRLT